MLIPSFDTAPFIVIWETTRACALACVHCRAEAMPHRNKNELSTEEGYALLDRVAAFSDTRTPLFVLTGGDPLRRRDIPELVRYGVSQGISMALTPSGTAAVTRKRLEELKKAKLSRLAISLDGSTEERHDAFRRVNGSYRFTKRIIDDARDLEMPLQINTTISRQTVDDLPNIAKFVEESGAVLWALFFLIPVGRALESYGLEANEIEDVLTWAADLQKSVPFGIKTTEAPHYHRVLAQQRARGDQADRRGIGRAGRAVTDGNGFVFIDHLGNICPSGFLPLNAGNVRKDDLVEIYRNHELFQSLRTPEGFSGKCGVCEFREICGGGSRARAFAATGDPLASDPGCSYQPKTETAPSHQRA